jgi:uncharacterized membrane protein YhiD involved in acid resistance
VEAGSFLGIPGASLAAAGLACGLPVVLAACTFALMISVMVVARSAIESANRWSSGELFIYRDCERRSGGLSRITQRTRSVNKKSLEHSATHRSHARAGKLNYHRDGGGDSKSGSKVAALRFFPSIYEHRINAE